MNCEICIEKYNGKERSKVECKKCEYVGCKTCVRQYVLLEGGNYKSNKCMNCKEMWSKDWMINTLGKTWMNTEYKKEIAKKLANESIANKEKNIRGAMIYEALRNQKEVNEHLDQEPNEKFIMPCQNGNCRGMLNEIMINNNKQYYCQLCTKSTCPSCLEVISDNHKCNKETVETIKTIQTESKPCPKCGERISKIDGCDQMWCVECKTTFSWNTGKIERGHIHNPHYYEYMRNNGGMPREEERVEEEGNPNLNKALEWMCKKRRMPGTNVEHIDNLINYMEYGNHISHVVIERLNKNAESKRENKVADYKYILGEIEKEELGRDLVKLNTSIEKDESLITIYKEIVELMEKMAEEIVKGNRNVEEYNKRVNEKTRETNVKLIKTLMKYNSKRMVVMYVGRKKERQYLDQAEMERDLNRYMCI